MQRSHLDHIPGLGHHRQKQLLEKFHSVEYVRQASVAQIAETPGIGGKLAQEIYDHFHPYSQNIEPEQSEQFDPVIAAED
jgi:excinuclease ABC subunit C